MHIQIPLLRGGNVKEHDLVACVNRSPWEIDVVYEDNLYWSIALSYLMTLINSGNVAFDQKLQQMLGAEYTDWRNVQNCIQSYNPFLNRYACFYNEKCKDFILKFKQHLANCIEERDQWFDAGFSKIRKLSVDSILQVASHVLECKIYHVSESSNIRTPEFHDPRLTCYPKGRNVSWDHSITLYGKKRAGKERERISFGISEKSATALQKTALRKILHLGGLFDRENHASIFSLRQTKGSLILRLLKHNDWKIAEKLLQKPVHILQKLSEAGFGTDPTTTLITEDEQEELFHHGLCSGGVKLLFLFYGCFINISTFSFSAGSSLQLDACIVRNLITLIPVINKIRKAFESSKIPNKSHIIAVRELEEFHAFHLRICRSLHDIKQLINCSDGLSDKLYNVEKHKDTMVAIIGAYREHFHMRQVTSSNETGNLQLIHYENYANYQFFFRNLDFQAALFFFDNFFALKEKLKLDDKVYEKIETSFARFLFLWKYYYKNANHLETRPRYISSSEKNASRGKTFLESPSPARHLEKFQFAITYLERLKLEDALEKFQSGLEATEVQEKSITQCLSSSFVHTLEGEPIIKDEITLIRLKHYINIALNVNLEDNLEMSVAAVERCLQVIGESISLRDGEIATVAKSLLTSALPHGAQDFRQICDFLSHLKCPTRKTQKEIEKDAKVFQKVVNELKNINSEFTHIFELQQLRMRKYAFQNGIDIVEKWMVSIKKTRVKHSPVVKLPNEEELDFVHGLFPDPEDNTSIDDESSSTSKAEAYGKSRCRMFNLKEFEKYFRNRIKVLRRCLNETNSEVREKSMNLFCHKHFETHFDWLEARYKNFTHTYGKVRKYKFLENRLLSIKCLLEFVVSESQCNEKIAEKLREKINSINLEDVCDPGKAKDLLKKYRDLVAYVFDKLKVLDKVLKVLDKVTSSSRLDNTSMEFKKASIRMFKDKFSDHNFSSAETKKNILSKVPQKYVQHHTAKNKLVTSLETDNILTDEEMDDVIEKLIIPSKMKKKVKAMYNAKDLFQIKKTLPDCLEKLKETLDNEAMSEKDYNDICDKLSLAETEMMDMAKIVLRQSSNKGTPESNIQKYRYSLTGCYLLLEQTKERILAEVPEKFEVHHEAKRKLKTSLEAGSFLSDEERDDTIRKLVLSPKKLKKVKEMYCVKDIGGLEKLTDYYQILREGLNDNEMAGGDYKIICDNFGFTEATQNELSKIVLGRLAKDETLEYFYDRLSKLKKLLIEDYPEINAIWTKATSLKSKAFGHDKLVHYYLQQPALQAAVEQILFDCMVILKGKRSDLEDLWIRMTYIFNGINIRNVLAYGNPLFEGVCHVLGPSDLPYEIIRKALELVSDIDAVKAMCRLRKEKDIGFEDLVENMKFEVHENDLDLWMAIKDCSKWQCYAYLLPRKRFQTTASESAEAEDGEETEDEDEDEAFELSN